MMLRCVLTVLLLAGAPFAMANEAALPFGEVLLQRMHGHDRDAMLDWEPALREQLQVLRDGDVDADSETAIRDMLRLLDVPRLDIAHDDDLVGACRVRSLQLDRYGAYAYPYFDCRIHIEARALILDKPTGSQRRLGMLGRLTDDRYLFLGGMYFIDESPRGYSAGLDADPTPEQVERDSIGHLFRIDNDHYVLAFAPRGGRHELYEIQRRP